jgi:hypothetical protein
MWFVIEGILVPFGSLSEQAIFPVSQNCVALQSLSFVQPDPPVPHTPLGSHDPERHTLGPSPVVQGPSPLASPHFMSLVSQTAERHTLLPFAAVQGPSPFA